MVIYTNNSINIKAGIALLSNELTELCSETIWDEEIRVLILKGIGEVLLHGNRSNWSDFKN